MRIEADYTKDIKNSVIETKGFKIKTFGRSKETKK